MARKGLSKKLRFDIFKRDNFLCRYCGRTVGQDVILEIDHVIPVIEGGTNDLLNLVTACFDCNRGKSKHLLTSHPAVHKDLREKAKLLKEQRAQVEAFLAYRNEQQAISLDIARRAIAPIIQSLADPNIIRAAEIAADRFTYGAANDPFLYFCGICRKSIKTGQEVGSWS